jgi:hypothetical protein
MLDLDELKLQWAGHNQKLDEVIRLNRQLLVSEKLNRARSALRRLATALALEVALQLAVVMALGSFTFDHRTELRFALPAAALDVFAIAILIALSRQIAAALKIDYDLPIVAIQKQIAGLRVLRLHYLRGIFITAALAWTPLLIIGLKAFAGIDAYKVLGMPYLAANLLFGLAIIPLAMLALRYFEKRMTENPVLHQFVRNLSGYNLNAAEAFLETLSKFKQDDGQ